MAAHRYWRVLCRINAGNGSFTGLTEIEMATSAAGADVSTSGFAIGSGSYQAGTASDAFDNDFTGDVVQWNGTGAGVYVGQDFGVGNDQDIVEWRIRPNKDAANRTFGEFDFQYSDDGSTWTTDFSGSYTGWSVGSSVTFSRPTAAAHRYWRIRPITSFEAGATIGLHEVEMRTSVDGSDQCTGGTASARTTFAGTSAANAFDDNATTTYSSNGGVSNSEWIQYDFGSGNDKSIVEVTIRSRDSAADWDQLPKSGRVESSSDGRSFMVRWSFANKAAARNYVMTCTDPGSLPAPGSTHRYWGIKFNTLQSGSTFPGLREIELRDAVGGTDQCSGGAGISIDPYNNAGTREVVGNLFDNGAAECGGNSLSEIFIYDFGQGNAIAAPPQVALTARAAANNPQAPTDFDVVWSDDNENWTVQQNFTTTADWGSAEQRLFSLATPPAGGRRHAALLLAG